MNEVIAERICFNCILDIVIQHELYNPVTYEQEVTIESYPKVGRYLCSRCGTLIWFAYDVLSAEDKPMSVDLDRVNHAR